MSSGKRVLVVGVLLGVGMLVGIALRHFVSPLRYDDGLVEFVAHGLDSSGNAGQISAEYEMEFSATSESMMNPKILFWVTADRNKILREAIFSIVNVGNPERSLLSVDLVGSTRSLHIRTSSGVWFIVDLDQDGNVDLMRSLDEGQEGRPEYLYFVEGLWRRGAPNEEGGATIGESSYVFEGGVWNPVK